MYVICYVLCSHQITQLNSYSMRDIWIDVLLYRRQCSLPPSSKLLEKLCSFSQYSSVDVPNVCQHPLEMFQWFMVPQRLTPDFTFSFNFSPIGMCVLHMSVSKLGELKKLVGHVFPQFMYWQRSKVHRHRLMEILIPHSVEVPLLHTQFRTAQHNTQRGCTSQWQLVTD